MRVNSRGRLLDLGLVVLGGAAGSLARAFVSAAIVPPGGEPGATLATLVVNVTGAFALGALVEVVARRGGARWRRARLLLGTGVLGGFTTYSLLAGELAAAVLDARIIWALGYAGATILGGAAASCIGVVAGRRIARTRGPRSFSAGTGR